MLPIDIWLFLPYNKVSKEKEVHFVYYKLMKKEVYDRFFHAANAWADIDPPVSSSGKYLRDELVFFFYKTEAGTFSHESKKLPKRFTVVYEIVTDFDGALHHLVGHYPCDLNSVQFTDKFIEFEGGPRVHLSKVFFFVY